MDLVRHIEVVDIAAFAPQQARIFGPGNRLADAETGGLDVGHAASCFVFADRLGK
jgi:hypothetical protein